MSALAKLRALRIAQAGGDASNAASALQPLPQPAVESETESDSSDDERQAKLRLAQQQNKTNANAHENSNASTNANSQVKKKRKKTKSTLQNQDSTAAQSTTAQPQTALVDKQAEAEFDSVLAEFKSNHNVRSGDKHSAANTNNALHTDSAFHATGHSSSGLPPIDWSHLAVTPQQLDADIELRQRFGSSAVRRHTAAADDEEQKQQQLPAPGPGERGRAPQPRRTVGASSSNLRGKHRQRYVLAKPQPDWPPCQQRGQIKLQRVSASQSAANAASSGGAPLSWQCADDDCLFEFAHSPEYLILESDWLDIQASHDVQSVAMFNASYCYHVASSLQLHELLEAQGEHARAAGFLERVLWFYEDAIIKANALDLLLAGRLRLDPSTSANRPFLFALAKQVQRLGKKGATKTATAVAKLLLSLNPLLDSQCTLLLIDHYCLRAQDYTTLRSLVDRHDQACIESMSQHSSSGKHCWSGQSSITSLRGPPSQPPPRLPCALMPGLNFSLALASFYEQQSDSSQESNADSSKPTSSLSTRPKKSSDAPTQLTLPAAYSGPIQAIQLPFQHTLTQTSSIDDELAPITSGSRLSCSHSLQQAILFCPEMVKTLIESSGNERLLNTSDWKSILSDLELLFDSASASQSKRGYIEKLCLVYGERSGQLFKHDVVMQWLQRECIAVIAAYKASVNLFATLRSAFLCGPRTVVPMTLQLLDKDRYSDTVTQLPPEMMLQQHQARIDPQDAMDILQMQELELIMQQGGGAGAGDQLSPEAVATRLRMLQQAGHTPIDPTRGTLVNFLTSLLPWMAAPVQGVQPDQDLSEDEQDEIETQHQHHPELHEFSDDSVD